MKELLKPLGINGRDADKVLAQAAAATPRTDLRERVHSTLTNIYKTCVMQGEIALANVISRSCVRVQQAPPVKIDARTLAYYASVMIAKRKWKAIWRLLRLERKAVAVLTGKFVPIRVAQRQGLKEWFYQREFGNVGSHGVRAATESLHPAAQPGCEPQSKPNPAKKRSVSGGAKAAKRTRKR